ncbi:hypothetical protein KUTeg_022870, partial [Tegillarca granosa]
TKYTGVKLIRVVAKASDPRYGVYSYDQPAAQHNGMNTSPPCNNAIARGDMEEARSSSSVHFMSL